jgi:hypothetical protein
MANCNRCGCKSEYSICSVISTLGKSPRRQKSTMSVPFCEDCLGHLVEERANRLPPAYRSALGSAYSALKATR